MLCVVALLHFSPSVRLLFSFSEATQVGHCLPLQVVQGQGSSSLDWFSVIRVSPGSEAFIHLKQLFSDGPGPLLGGSKVVS